MLDLFRTGEFDENYDNLDHSDQIKVDKVLIKLREQESCRKRTTLFFLERKTDRWKTFIFSSLSRFTRNFDALSRIKKCSSVRLMILSGFKLQRFVESSYKKILLLNFFWIPLAYSACMTSSIARRNWVIISQSTECSFL